MYLTSPRGKLAINERGKKIGRRYGEFYFSEPKKKFAD